MSPKDEGRMVEIIPKAVGTGRDLETDPEWKGQRNISPSLSSGEAVLVEIYL